MIQQNTITVTNAIELSIAYLKRFFSKVGEVESISKDQQKGLVYVEFKEKSAIGKVLGFNRRVLDKKPIEIKLYNALAQLHKQNDKLSPIQNNQTPNSQSQNPLKPKLAQKKPHQKKVPGLHQFTNKTQFKLQIRSQYRVIQHSDLQQTQIKFQNSPLEGIKDKKTLWKVILYQLSKNLSNDNTSKELVLSIALGLWALFQLKLRQIEYLMRYNINQKSKYFDNFIQELLISKLKSLHNPNLISHMSKYKPISEPNMIVMSLHVPYPDQCQQEAKFYCDQNEKVHELLGLLYGVSEFVGKVYHELVGNSLILYEDKVRIKRIVGRLRDRVGGWENDRMEIEQGENKAQLSQLTQKTKTNQQPTQQPLPTSPPNPQPPTYQSTINSPPTAPPTLPQNCFTGQIQNHSPFIFHSLLPYQPEHRTNSTIWLQLQHNRPTSHPKWFLCNFLFRGCDGRVLMEMPFCDILEVDLENDEFQRKEQHQCQDIVVVFEQGQFLMHEVWENVYGFIVLEVRTKLQDREKRQTQKNKQPNQQLHSVINVTSSLQGNVTSILVNNLTNTQGQHSKIPISNQPQINIDVILIGIDLKLRQKYLISTYKHFLSRIASQFPQNNPNSPKINTHFTLFQIIPQKQSQLNSFKLQHHLIAHIDRHILAKGVIIPSQELAEKIAQKLKEQAPNNELYGFRDKKYIGNEIWRLYNKSGARRVKEKILLYEKYNKKKLKSQ